jgi:N terminal of Calcineurin-like phosphoesterase
MISSLQFRLAICITLIPFGSVPMVSNGIAQPPAQIAQGVVYEDLNNNRRRDADEPGIKDIKVSNGKDIVLTDNDGKYQIPVSDDCIVFVIKPRGWMTPLNSNKLPQFYYIHKPTVSFRSMAKNMNLSCERPGVQPIIR